MTDNVRIAALLTLSLGAGVMIGIIIERLMTNGED